jgi:hypothetical protein
MRRPLWATGVPSELTSRPVHQAPNVIALMAQHMEFDPPDPAGLNPDVPPALGLVILRALARRPEDRWQTAAALLEALESV